MLLNCHSIATKLLSNCYEIALQHRCPRCVTTPHTYATLWFQRCSGVFQRPALCSIAAPAPHGWILTPHSGSGATLVDSSASFLYKIEVLASPWYFSAPYFYAVFGFHAALTDSNEPFLRSLAAPAPHGWTPAFHAHATSCEQRSCTRDTGEQLLRRSLAATNKDKERRLSPLNQPLDSLNFAMIVPYVHPYRYLLPVGPHVCSFSIVFCELKCNGSFKGIIRLI